MESSNEILKRLDLTENEVKVYLFLLSIEKASASTISYRTEIAKNSCRYICEQLIEKGLVHLKKVKNTFVYQAEPPEKLYYLIEEEERMIKRKKEDLDRVINELKATHDPEIFLPKITFNTGFEKVIGAYDHFFKLTPENSTVYNFVHPVSNQHSEFKKGVIKCCEEARNKKNIHIKCLSSDSKSSRELIKSDALNNRETRINKHIQTYNFGYEVLINEEFVFEITYSDKGIFSNTINNLEIVKMRIEIFKLAWGNSK